MLTQERLKELLHYDQETGAFTWVTDMGYKVKKSSVAGYTNGHGYRQIILEKKSYKMHRLAWLYIYGKLPNDQIDHINGIKTDNRISNLRDVSCFENKQNILTKQKNKSGVTGVYKRRDKYIASISVKRKSIYLGIFESLEKAESVRIEAKQQFHPSSIT